MILCICRGASEKQVAHAIEKGASTLRDLQRCGIGDECGSCHNALRMMLAVECRGNAVPFESTGVAAAVQTA